jgi:hypothetical protein
MQGAAVGRAWAAISRAELSDSRRGPTGGARTVVVGIPRPWILGAVSHERARTGACDRDWGKREAPDRWASKRRAPLAGGPHSARERISLVYRVGLTGLARGKRNDFRF